MFLPTRLGVTIQSCRAILWLASWIVPRPLRREWSAMWRSKVWHWANFLAEAGRLDGRNQRILLRTAGALSMRRSGYATTGRVS